MGVSLTWRYETRLPKTDGVTCRRVCVYKTDSMEDNPHKKMLHSKRSFGIAKQHPNIDSPAYDASEGP